MKKIAEIAGRLCLAGIAILILAWMAGLLPESYRNEIVIEPRYAYLKPLLHYYEYRSWYEPSLGRRVGYQRTFTQASRPLTEKDNLSPKEYAGVIERITLEEEIVIFSRGLFDKNLRYIFRPDRKLDRREAWLTLARGQIPQMEACQQLDWRGRVSGENCFSSMDAETEMVAHVAKRKYSPFVLHPELDLGEMLAEGRAFFKVQRPKAFGNNS